MRREEVVSLCRREQLPAGEEVMRSQVEGALTRFFTSASFDEDELEKVEVMLIKDKVKNQQG